MTADPVDGWYPIQVGEVNGWVCGDYVIEESSYSYGETKEEEQKRMEAEEAAAAEAEAEARLQKRRLSQLRQGRKLLIMPVSLLGIHMCGAVQV